MKLPRISIGLDPHTLEMLEAAERALVQNKASFQPPEPHEANPRWRTWFCRWAIMVVARAVAEAGELPIPLGVDLRPETPEESAERCGKDYTELKAKYGPKQTEAATNGPVKIRFKWTPTLENLN